MRILFVTARYVPDIGGTELHTKELAVRLAGRGHDVTVLTTDPWNERPAFEVIEGVRIRRVRAWPADRDHYFAPGMHRIISRGDWDIVHCQGYHTFVAPIAMLAARRAGLPYIVSFHSGGHSSRLRRALRPVQRLALRPLLAGAARLVSGSQYENQFFRAKLRLPPERLTMIPVGVDLPATVPPDPDSDGRLLILSLGRLERYKGHHRVIEALPLVADALPNAHLRVVGEGPYEPELRRLVAVHCVDDLVEIRGVPVGDRAAIARLLSQAALVISLSEYESAGIAAREALSLRRQTLVARTSALSELSDVPLIREIPLTASREEVAATIVDMLRRPAQGEGLAMATWDEVTTAHENLYRDAIRGRRCAS